MHDSCQVFGPFVMGQRQAGLHEPSHELKLRMPAGQDAFLMESLFRNEVWGHLEAPVSETNESAVYSSMIEGCRC